MRANMRNPPRWSGGSPPVGPGHDPRGSTTAGRPQTTENALEAVWPGYLGSGYFDADGSLKPDFVIRSKVEPLVRAMTESGPRLTSHQIRRFFQHCRAIEARLKANRTTWRKEEGEFRKLDVAAADAFGKGARDPREAKIPRLFHDFIERNVQSVKTERDFLEGFLPHFEALVGFGSKFLADDRGRR
jgi:CRISPR type III-A-associated protein Csm2